MHHHLVDLHVSGPMLARLTCDKECPGLWLATATSGYRFSLSSRWDILELRSYLDDHHCYRDPMGQLACPMGYTACIVLELQVWLSIMAHAI